MTQIAWNVLPLESLAERAAEWDQLVEDNGYPPFLRFAFIDAAIRSFGCLNGRVALAYQGPRLAAGAILEPSGAGRWRTYQPSQLPLGAVVVSRGIDAGDIFHRLLPSLPGMVVMISITQLDPRLVDRPTLGRAIDVMNYASTAWIDVSGSFDDFWASRGKNLRQNVRKHLRRLEEDLGPVRLDVLIEPAEVLAALEEYSRLECSGWKGHEGTAIDLSTTQGEFYTRVLEDFSRKRRAFAWRLVAGLRPLAVEFGLDQGGTVVVLKTTYDESLQSVSPAQILREMAYRTIFERQGSSRIEFYGRVMDWHMRWTDNQRMLFHLNVYRSPTFKALHSMVRGLRGRGSR